MDRKYGYCVFYVFLLMTITPAMCRSRAKADQSEKRSEKRQFPAALPVLSSIAGTAVAPWLFVALAAAYGYAKLRQYRITEAEDWTQDKCYPSKCAGYRGQCRWSCFSQEYPIWWYSVECGGACPCCVVDYVYEEITGRRPR